MRRLLSFAVMTLLLGSPVYAGDGEAAEVTPKVELATVVGPVGHVVSFMDRGQKQLTTFASEHKGLAALSVAYLASSVVDWHSTLVALGGGAHELNPVLGPVVQSPAGFLVVKTALTATTLCAVQQVWKRNHTAAIATLIGVTVAESFIAGHNYSLR